MGNKVIAYTNQLNADGVGDFVQCVNCGKLFLVGIGEEVCPKCKDEMFKWANIEHQECNIEELEKLGYEVEVR